MKIYIIVDLQKREPEAMFYTEQKARNYLIKEGYTERKKEPKSFYYNPDNDLKEQQVYNEYDMVIYEKEVKP